jgi:2-polyprenyl-6-methoxyphenol hydroxylase-like FAD-dependent oxidoreductase
MNASLTLVVGAGPTGLALALELTRLGHPVRVIDARETFSPLSRAIGVNPRTLQLLAPTGVTDDLLARGTRVPALRIHSGRRLLMRAPFEALPGPYNFLLTVPQEDTERSLEAALNARGVCVERGVALECFKHDATGVTAQLRTAQGPQEIRVARLAGADGVRSRVRDACGVAYRGGTDRVPWALADATLDGDLPANEALVFTQPGAVTLAFPFGRERGLYRVVSNGSDPFAGLPAQVRVGTPRWQSSFTIQHRLADRYQVGRVFLAGDAAHAHSPVGARGMNLGIEDAVTLARLIHLGREGAYHALRRRKGRHVVRLTTLQTHLLTTQAPLATQVRDALLPLLVGVPFLRRQALLEFTGQR